ncbi:NAD(P)-dependent oxidoreductase [bacterium]|nr:MAG: NAD(P)-dependent oxidoreductase [bacterium]
MNKRKILVTGSEGLIGRAVETSLRGAGFEVFGLDIRGSGPRKGDVRDPEAVERALVGVCGVIHLAAVSRVLWGEKDPAACISTNVGGTKNLLETSLSSPLRPWVLFASSREVYGEAKKLPVKEDSPLRPVNLYGRTKAEGEKLTMEAREKGLSTAVVRFSNVYGSVLDYPDRVVPAFARAAAFGGEIRVEGEENLFDFTHVDDTARGVLALVNLLEAGERNLPPVHLLTGSPCTLGELVGLAAKVSRKEVSVASAPSRSFDVARFYGDPGRAERLLGWRAEISLAEGFARLCGDYEAGQGS